jgi:hypothetical protein
MVPLLQDVVGVLTQSSFRKVTFLGVSFFLVEAVTLWLQIFVRFLLDPLGVRGSSVAILTQVLPSCSHTALRRRAQQSHLCIRWHRGHRYWDRAGGKGWLDLMRYADMHMICTWYAHDMHMICTWCQECYLMLLVFFQMAYKSYNLK